MKVCEITRECFAPCCKSFAVNCIKQQSDFFVFYFVAGYLASTLLSRFIGTTMEDNAVNIFMEYVPGGSLALVLKRFVLKFVA